MDCPQVLPDLKRVIGGEGRALLQRFDLLHPLVEQMVTQAVLADVEISDEDFDQARLELLEERGYGRLDQWSELLNEIGRSDQEVLDRMAAVIRRQSLMREQFAAKAKARFLDRKHELDRWCISASNETVMKVVPFGSLEASVEVPSNKIGLVKVPVGCPKQLVSYINADISIDSYPATDLSIWPGEVIRIGSDALAPDPQEQRQELSYPVTINFTQQQSQMKSGNKLPLQVGMSPTCNINCRKVFYLQLLLGEFQDKPESLQRL